MRRLAVAALSVAVWTACGPSLRQLHRGDVYYERCYAADHDTRVPVEERRACWQAWIREWSGGQPPARVGYARERILRLHPDQAALVALATGDSGAETLAPSVPDPPPEPSATADEDSGAEQSPPAQEPEAAGEDSEAAPIPAAVERRARRRVVLPATLTPHCARGCEPAWSECTTRCQGPARSACITACRVELRTCARGCF